MIGRIVLALCAVLLLASCDENECEGLSSCPCGFVCIEGQCVADGICTPPTMDPVDLGPRDMEDAGDGEVSGDADLSTGPDVPDLGDSGISADVPDLSDVGDTGTTGEVLPNRNEVWASLVSTSMGDEYAALGYLQDRSSQRFMVSRQSFSAMGETCELVDRVSISGGPARFFVQEILLDSLFNEGAPRRLFSDSAEPGRYAAIVSQVPRFFTPGGPVEFEIRAGPTGDPTSLGALPSTSLSAPSLVQALTPSVAGPIGLDGPVSFTWIQNSIGGSTIRFEVRTLDDLLTLTCIVADDGGFTLPAAAGAAFLAARGMRLATLSVLRVASTDVMVSRSSGGTETVELRVEVGARYDVR
ncbi:MAG: hypothetical protein AAFZ18_22465 [Myxococcota bacterium]